MENMIVTVTNVSKTYLYDLEIPATVVVEKLKEDIVATLKGKNPNLVLESVNARLFCNRLGRQLTGDETFGSAGVWNGDYITIIEV